MSARKFVRVYRDLSNEYPDIYDDAEALGTYCQLLMDADALWPMHPTISRRVKNKPLEKLTATGLVILEDRDRYTIKGLDKLREAESEQGRRDVAKRRDRDPTRTPHRDPTRTPFTTRPDQTRPDQTNAREARESSKTTNGNSPYLKIDTGPNPVSDVIASLPSFEEAMRMGESSNASEGTATMEVKP